MNQDLIDLLKLLKEEGVKFRIVGGYAVIKHTEPRYTKDIDIWVETSQQNAKGVFSALKKFGAPLTGLKEEDFTDSESFYTMGLPPSRVDILTDLKGVKFLEAWDKRVEGDFGGEPIFYISIEDLLVNKKAVGRLQDLADAEKLEYTISNKLLGKNKTTKKVNSNKKS